MLPNKQRAVALYCVLRPTYQQQMLPWVDLVLRKNISFPYILISVCALLLLVHYYRNQFVTKSWLYLLRYITGDKPVMRLNVVRKAFGSLYPTSYITSLIFFRLFSNCFFAASTFTRCIYSIKELEVAFLNLLSRFLLPRESADAN